MAVPSGPNIGWYEQFQVVQIYVGTGNSKWSKYRWVLAVPSGPNLGRYWQFQVPRAVPTCPGEVLFVAA